VPAYTGYTLIATNHGINDTTFCDSNGGAGLSPGVSYSYIVDGFSPPAQADGGSQSYASNDTCITIKLGVPLITNVSVTKTDPAKGEMFIRWMRPIADTADLDTIQYPPPYKYVLEHATGMSSNSFTAIKTYTTAVFRDFIDTTYTDTGLNTQQNSYNYKIDFYANNKYAGSSGTASSIYLKLQRGDQSMNLGWAANVPWSNDTMYIYRQGPLPGYSFIAKTVGNTTYTDTGLHNGSQYCYYVESHSEYAGAPRVKHPLYDSSETTCGTPEDTIAPCSPPLSINAKCVLYEDSLMWSNPNRLCPKANKVVGYEIFYSPTENGDLYDIANISNPEDTVYVNGNLTSVAGCYAVLAVDSAGQTSPFNTVCVDNCPDYQLPNVFTPNGDGTNDLFTPLEPFRYVKDIDINIFNRWGQIVFHTTDPIINWNGNVDNTGGPCPDGVYYYICVVNEIRLAGIVPITLKGFIQLIRK
jgi:gliding motility-associated-like protein